MLQRTRFGAENWEKMILPRVRESPLIHSEKIFAPRKFFRAMRRTVRATPRRGDKATSTHRTSLPAKWAVRT
jgi:hypothetical protein